MIVRAGHVDRRAKTIEITPKGLETAERVKQLLMLDRMALFAGVTPAQLEAAYAVMRSIGEQLQRLENDEGAGV
ncbi:hypothetical protein SDC9_162444 [bioreactor metagenome]|uniref:HTH marR-type domain-containing protein n=1 Tax=bioreactor metagenome TaxID=1076179 RepID=A0A645FL46_9ZZZZ